MGTPIRQPKHKAGWETRQPYLAKDCLWAPSQRVSIDLDADCLRRLLGARQLHVQDFSCADAFSKECVRQLLLQTMTSAGRR